MNIELFKDHMSIIEDIINQNEKINIDEMAYRKSIITKEYNNMLSNKVPTIRFYQLSHEIRCVGFLAKYGNLHIASDQNDEPGCDFNLNNNIQIEAVCCSLGNQKINGFDKIPKKGVIDYNHKEKILLSRITSSINEKFNFYKERVNKSIDANKPYIIFIGLGELTYGMINFDYGFELNKILCGVSHPYLTYDRLSDSFSSFYYSYNKEINVEKFNNEGLGRNVEIPVMFFCNPENEFVSAIIYSTASLESEYNPSNTFIFLNPYAKNKIKISDFKNVYYWKMDKEGKYNLRKNGKKYSHNKNKKFF